MVNMTLHILYNIIIYILEHLQPSISIMLQLICLNNPLLYRPGYIYISARSIYDGSFHSRYSSKQMNGQERVHIWPIQQLTLQRPVCIAQSVEPVN